ncbi:cytochrome c assembly protein [Desulfurobacterium thermolithotrophum DSM 11699]|uniref:Cytochrome c assembly protein n=1 Tax=Desulfurobacterium thermolithotrophum (strain DSM 11699 / BSA) TaxID=868864 RepID=F0S2Y4_DESTD|nr:cytochrome c biogenesis protein CcsA [Desulfurobacterium thermolithotrophum]ADY73206.1 cytochrome c assembly protein [Desulfurobacterium thermolithotrophum DSM 11699]
MSTDSFIYTTAVLYVISALHYLLFLVLRKDKLATVGLYGARIGFLTNLIAVILLAGTGGGVSLFTEKGAFLLFGISTVSIFLYFSTKHKFSISGTFLMPWAAISLIVASLASGIPKNIFPVGVVGVTHIVSAFLGYSAFVFAAITSLIYLIFERHLKKKKFSVFYHKLTSLSLLESIVYHSLTVGFMFITISMFAGAIWSEKIFGSYWSWHPKEIATLVTWFTYAGIIHLYLYNNWKGKKLCYMSMFGFLLIVLNFLGINFFSDKDIHSFKG